MNHLALETPRYAPVVRVDGTYASIFPTPRGRLAGYSAFSAAQDRYRRRDAAIASALRECSPTMGQTNSAPSAIPAHHGGHFTPRSFGPGTRAGVS